MIEAALYTSNDAQEWDAFVRGSRNGTFLHERGFMDYHARRFTDASLVIRSEGAIVAVLPANREGNGIVSHGGLTYGGLIASDRLGQSATLEAMRMATRLWRASGALDLTYKPVPHIFHSRPFESDLYALYLMGAKLSRRDAGCVVDLTVPGTLHKGRRWNVRRAAGLGVSFETTSDPTPFHALLSNVLLKHDVTPAHTVAEMALLMKRFPDQILLHSASLDGRLLAGAWTFRAGPTLHTQYLANTHEGRGLGALDGLVAHIMKSNARYLSFGISTEDGGAVLNEGLMAYKEGFGGRTVVHDTYHLNL